MRIKIDEDVPMPGAYGTTSDLPFVDMKVGDSFAVPKGISRSAVHAAIMRASKKHKAAFAVRSVKGKLRCWRTR